MDQQNRKNKKIKLSQVCKTRLQKLKLLIKNVLETDLEEGKNMFF